MMKYPLNKVLFIYKNKGATNVALYNYLANLDFNTRILLKTEFEKNPQYKQEFGIRLSELGNMINSLFKDTEDLKKTNVLVQKLIQREKTNDLYIINMYRDVVSALLKNFADNLPQESLIKINDLIEIILQDTQFYENVKDIFEQYS